MQNRKSFIIHKDSLDILDKLSDEQAGKLFKAIKFFQKENSIPKLEFTLDLVFTPFLNQFLRDEENYKIICERRREAGAKGGKQKLANASKCKQNIANLADSDSKSKNDSDSKNDNKNDLPIFINKNLFDDFSEMRKKLRKPLTEKAKELIIKKISEFEAKQQGSANKALENSIENSWQGVFEPKGNQQQNQTSGSYLDYLTGGKNGSI